MIPVDHEATECPSWASLARFVAEGGPWPAEHLRNCASCRERRLFLEGLNALGDAAKGTGDCPDVWEIAALVDGRVGRRRRRHLADHLASCEGCAGLLRELVARSDGEVLDGEVRENPVRDVQVDRLRDRWARGASLLELRRIAAAVVIGVALTIVYMVPFPSVESGAGGRWRGPAPRLEAILSWPPQGGNPTLNWGEWKSATSYRIRVWNESGRRLLEHHLAAEDDRELALSLAGIQRGDLLIWQVDALEMGRVIASSGPSELRWEPR